MAEPIPFKSATEQCREESIEVLERLLGLARSGKITSLAVGYVTPMGGIDAYFSEGNACGLLGSVALLQHRLLVACEES